MLPSIDDGAKDLPMALDMARAAVASGVTKTVCTPHIYQGLFDNTAEGIAAATDAFRAELAAADIPLEISYGADIQIVPDLSSGLRSGRLPTLNQSRYFLFEPPHHVASPGLLDLVHNTLSAGYVPIITHPERLAYAEADYDKFIEATRLGAWIQVTGGAFLGVFGPRVQKLAERFLRDGAVHIIASDGHNLKNRPPTMGPAREHVLPLVGEDEAKHLTETRPAAVWFDHDPQSVPKPIAVRPQAKVSLWRKLLGRG
jgi:protein-tyrosine phosphatase